MNVKFGNFVILYFYSVLKSDDVSLHNKVTSVLLESAATVYFTWEIALAT